MTLLKYLAVVALLSATSGPAFAREAASPAPSASAPALKPDSNLILGNGSIVRVAHDGQHVGVLKGGTFVLLPPGPVKLKNGMTIVVGAGGVITGHKGLEEAVAPSRPGTQ